MSEPISLFVPKFEVEECLAEIRKCLEIGWTGLGFKTVEFEDSWKSYTGLPHAHFLASNTIGLQLALKVFKETRGWTDDSEVITTPLTFISTNHAILLENLQPQFADVDETLCLSLDSIKKKVGPKTKAVMFVGFGGQIGELKQIAKFCKANDIVLILDAAHMAGTKYDNQHVGFESDCTIFSYQAVKNLPTGDAGMICFKEASDDEVVRKMSWLGINKDTYARSKEFGKGNYKWLYDVEYTGYKAHGNSIMASIALVQLRYLERDNTHRRALCAKYDDLLVESENLRIVRHRENCTSSRHLYQIRTPQKLRNEVIIHLNENQIFPGVHYRSNLDYKMYSFAKGTCPLAEQISQEIISLPLHVGMQDKDVVRVSQVLNDFLGNK